MRRGTLAEWGPAAGSKWPPELTSSGRALATRLLRLTALGLRILHRLTRTASNPKHSKMASAPMTRGAAGSVGALVVASSRLTCA